MNTKLQGLAQRADKLFFRMEGHADKFGARLDAMETRGDKVFARSHAALDERESHLKDIEGFVNELERATNGGPTLGSDGSPPGSSKAFPSGATSA